MFTLDSAKKKLVPTMLPVEGGWYSSNYGWRIDPFTGQRAFHEGIDFIAEQGTPIFAAAGGVDIRCAPYATFGTQALSDHALAALAERKACLLAHHGVIACEASLPQALALAIEVEHLARMYLAACALGEPPRLPDDEMARVLAKFEHYGQQGPSQRTGP